MTRDRRPSPGPWSVHYEEPGYPGLYDMHGRRVKGIKLWEDDANFPGGDLNDTIHANHRLTAAAPDLLEACLTALGALGVATNPSLFAGDLHSAYAQAIEEIGAAVAKAVGK